MRRPIDCSVTVVLSVQNDSYGAIDAGHRSDVVIRDNEQRRETAPKPRKTAESRPLNYVLVTLREAC
jgi:hypothetical protein